MALVLFANTKGGSGKTTAALVLAGELVKHRAKVVLLEGDPNRPLMNWAQARGMTVLETSRSRVTSPTQAAELLEGGVDHPANVGFLVHVGDDRHRARQCLRNGGQLAFRSGRQDKFRSPGRESFGQGLANAFRGTRDDHDFVLRVHDAKITPRTVIVQG